MRGSREVLQRSPRRISLVLLVAAFGCMALASQASAINVNIDSHIHRFCWPSEGVSKTDYNSGGSQSYASVRGQLYAYHYLSGGGWGWYLKKENTDFSGYGPSGTARVALHFDQVYPLYQYGKHAASWWPGNPQYTDHQDNVVCS